MRPAISLVVVLVGVVLVQACRPAEPTWEDAQSAVVVALDSLVASWRLIDRPTQPGMRSVCGPAWKRTPRSTGLRRRSWTRPAT